jgi:hypothetical protein
LHFPRDCIRNLAPPSGAPRRPRTRASGAA